MQYTGRIELKKEAKNKSEFNSYSKETEKKYPITTIYYAYWIAKVYGWLILMDETFSMKEKFEKKINELVELFMNSLPIRNDLIIKDVFVYMAPAKNMGKELNGKPIIYADLILGNQHSPGKSVSEKLNLNTTGACDGITISVNGFDLKDKALDAKYGELVYSSFRFRLVNPQSRLLDLRDNALRSEPLD